MANDRRKILRAIHREARAIGDPRARRVFKKTAVEIPLVEAGGLRNPTYGDQDSTNLRQERASGYAKKWARTGGSQNIDAIVRRMREEFQQQYVPGQKSYEAAANIQRPREDLRGRYRDVAGKAARIVKNELNGGASAPNMQEGASYRTTTTTTPGVDNSEGRKQAKLAYLQGSHDPDALLNLGLSLRGLQDTPSSSTTKRVRIKGSGGLVTQTGSALVDQVKQEADLIDKAHVGYQWGGGHAGKQIRGSKVTPLDCSGAVSRVLGVDPKVSGEFEKWGKPGRGRVTVYANGHHVLMEINGHFWGTSASNPGGGPGWIPRGKIPPGYLKNFKARHA